MPGNGWRAPLFERLMQPADAPRALLDEQALADSVAAELQRLLNSRAPGQAPGILGYGLDDWSGVQAQRDSDRQRLARDLRRAISRYEPRLRLDAVEVQADPRHPQRLTLHLHGWLRQGDRLWPALFVASSRGHHLDIRHERLDR